jgi:hypothetical protein
MYHTIVKRIALENFLRVNRKDYAAILKSCSPDVHHRFGGHHALGGERHDREALRRWFERLGRLAPTLQLAVHDVWVKLALEYNDHNSVVRRPGPPRWLTVQQPRRSHHSHALGKGVRYRCKRGFSTCCRILADMGRTRCERGSCRSHCEPVMIARSPRSKHDEEF